MTRDLSQFTIQDILKLSRSENVGPVTFFELLKRYGTPAKAIEAIPELSRMGGRKKPLRLANNSDIAKEIEETEKSGARFLVCGDSEYPALLATTSDAPPIITALGKHRFSKQPYFAIVGSRNASINARRIAAQISEDLGRAKVITVSGLARGIDGEVHNASLTNGTVAVIAGGIDNIYPPEHKQLYQQIQQNGLIVTEQPFGSSPVATNFPRRNRIISGISCGVLVVEAALGSGSLITARYAADQGRDVFAIPGFPGDPRCKGTNRLIKEGAYMVENSDDIIPVILSSALHNGVRDVVNSSFEMESAVMPDYSDSERKLVMDLLGASPISLDSLINDVQLPAAVVRAIILEFELAGRVERMPGDKISMIFNEPAYS